MGLYNSYSDEDLIKEMQLAIKQSNSNTLNLAFSEFYSRHKQYIYSLCIYFCKNFPEKESLINEMFQVASIKIYENIHSFDPTRIKSINTIKSWIGTTIRNLIIDSIKQNKRRIDKPITEEEWFYLSENTQFNKTEINIPTPIEKQALERALATLSEKHKMILFEYYNLKDISNKNSRIPKGLLEEIASRHNTTKENVKKIISRVTTALSDSSQKELIALRNI